MSTFQDAIRSATRAAWDNNTRDVADAVLAMPEMEAIRQIISRAYEPKNWTSYANKAQLHRSHMELDKVPESVIEWVLG